MFIGHYALGYYLKRRYREVPLWLLLLSVQFVDLLWAIFMLLGIERASYDPNASVFLRAVYEYYPYSHSLFTMILVALLIGGLVYKVKGKLWGAVVGIGVLSHWFLDLLVHAKDVPLFFDSYKYGFGLWQYPVLVLILELALFTVALWYVLKTDVTKMIRRVLVGTYLFLAFFYTVSFFAPPIPPTPVQVGVFGILIYGLIPGVVYYFERREKNHPREWYSLT
jgi:hypothetical protein